MSIEIPEYLDALFDQLNRENLASETIKLRFAKQKDGAAKIRYCLALFDERNLLPSVPETPQPKNASISSDARNNGNDYFKEENYVLALECYNRSICHASENSEDLSIGYANRSAVYLKTGFYKFCLQNIECALKTNYPERLRQKLEQRRRECLKLMKTQEDCLEKHDKEKVTVALSYAANERIPIMIDGLEVAKSTQFGRYIRTKRDLYPGEACYAS